MGLLAMAHAEALALDGLEERGRAHDQDHGPNSSRRESGVKAA